MTIAAARAAPPDVPHAGALPSDEVLFGPDLTEGIVSVSATHAGRAMVWRRVAGGVVEASAERFQPWLVLDDRALLADLDPATLSAQAGRWPDLPRGARAGVLELEMPGVVEPGAAPPGSGDAAADATGAGGGANTEPPAGFRYLALARDFRHLEDAILRATGAQRLWDLRERVYYRPPVEQYLVASGRTYYKGLLWEDVHRLQFDLETTALGPRDGEVFMITLRDSTGWERVLDAAELGGEAALLREFVATVRERDPDVLEGHNVFEFDLPFLRERCHEHGITLALGRQGDEPVEGRDGLKIGARTERFTRLSVAGREIVDTLHAVKRRDAIVHEIRSYGLKAAARYFGVASPEREYVAGSEIHATYLRDPERVRRYALDDVREVDALARLLMASSFALASMVPKPYERVATAGTGQGLIEPLLVRAYLWAGRALPRAGAATTEERYIGGYTRMYLSGILSHVVKADVASLYPSIMLAYDIAPRSDSLRVFPRALRTLTELRLEHKGLSRAAPADSGERVYHEAMQGAMKILINSFYGSMGAGFALFGDIGAATRVTRTGQEILLALMRALRGRGLRLIEADTDGVYFSVPEDWSYQDELRLVAEVGEELPAGITVEHDGRYRRMYSNQEKNYVLQEYDGTIRKVGAGFRDSRNEAYGDRFVNEALPHLLDLDFPAVRACFERTVRALREREVPVEDLLVSVRLTKSEEQYRAAGKREEQYEVLLAAGRRWRPDQIVRYYHAAGVRGGKKKLYEAGARDYDAEYYVKKLRETYAARLSKAVAPEDQNTLFGEMRGLFDRDPSEIEPVVTVEHPPED